MGIRSHAVDEHTHLQLRRCILEWYSFCHFDVDLYEGTLACLRYFYDRMLPGGIMLSHDYGLLAGVEAAFTEFFADKPERVIELPTTQCMVVKL